MMKIEISKKALFISTVTLMVILSAIMFYLEYWMFTSKPVLSNTQEIFISIVMIIGLSSTLVLAFLVFLSIMNVIGNLFNKISNKIKKYINKYIEIKVK